MKRFVELFRAVDRTTKTTAKRDALRAYFEEAPPRDAAWALRLLTGKRIKRAVNYHVLGEAAAEAAGVPGWLLKECHAMAGDLSETVALLLPPPTRGAGAVNAEPLHAVVEQRLLPMRQMSEAEQAGALREAWSTLDAEGRFVFHKLLSGTFRFGAARKLVTRAFAEAAGVDPAVMEHRLLGAWDPTPGDYARLRLPEGEGEGDADDARPYPFYLASPVSEASMATAAQMAALCGPIDAWQLEPKWDGIRCQVLRRGDAVLAWSRGEEPLNDAFPELVALAQALPDGTVLDGELLAWEGDAPLPFGALQKRLNRKGVTPMLFADVPVAFLAYDVLEHAGEDARARPTVDRRALLAAVVDAADDPTLRLSPVHEPATWVAAEALVRASRERGVEGLIVKRRDSPYGSGRTRGDWWKWKVDPYTVDCVMVYAQRGSGRRASIYTDYTFAVWDGDAPGEGALVPVTKAYSGLTDDEFDAVDRWIKGHTVSGRGAFRAVEPGLVFEIAFEGINRSARHKSGVALRFPRMHRWRTDKRPGDADTLASLKALLR